MPKVKFVNENQEIEVPEGANLRKEARKAGIQVNFHVLDTAGGFFGRYLNCLGMGSCGTCAVLVKKGKENLSPPGLKERMRLSLMLSRIGHEDEMRLACQVRVNGDCEIVTRPAFNWSGDNFWQKPYPNK
jgi:ferredoxin